MRRQVTWAVMDILEVSWGPRQTRLLFYCYERRRFSQCYHVFGVEQLKTMAAFNSLENVTRAGRFGAYVGKRIQTDLLLSFSS